MSQHDARNPGMPAHIGMLVVLCVKNTAVSKSMTNADSKSRQTFELVYATSRLQASGYYRDAHKNCHKQQQQSLPTKGHVTGAPANKWKCVERCSPLQRNECVIRAAVAAAARGCRASHTAVQAGKYTAALAAAQLPAPAAPRLDTPCPCAQGST